MLLTFNKGGGADVEGTTFEEERSLMGRMEDDALFDGKINSRNGECKIGV